MTQMSRTRTSDVIRNFVLEGKDKAKDTGPEDKDLKPRTKLRTWDQV